MWEAIKPLVPRKETVMTKDAKKVETKELLKKPAEALEKDVATQIEQDGAEVITDASNKSKNPKVTAKAGKRSEKAIKESEEKVAKEVRKTAQKEATEAENEKPKIQQKPARSVLERKGKSFRKVAELVETGKNYSLKEALALAIKASPVKFDATVEVHARLGVDPRQADQNLRDTIVLPAGTGRTIKVAVFADADGVAAAKKAGADIASSDEFLQQLEKGVIDFDILVATPSMMPKLGKFARLLGPKGLMPNPKSGTVTLDVAKAVTEAKAGRLEYRVDSTGIIHAGVGKVSFGQDKLLSNVSALMNSIKSNKPSSLKGNYIITVFITTSMGPSIPVNISEF